VQQNLMKTNLALLIFGGWLACGFSFFHKKEAVSFIPPGSSGGGPTQGMRWLYKLMGDEKDVSKILIIKREDFGAA